MRFPLVVLVSAAHRSDDRRVVGLNGMALVGNGLAVLHICELGRNRVLSLPGVGAPRKTGILQRLKSLGRKGLLCFTVRPNVVFASEPDSSLISVFLKICIGSKVILDLHEDYLDSTRLYKVPKRLRVATVVGIRALLTLLSKGSDCALCIGAERVRLLPMSWGWSHVAIIRNAICRREVLEQGYAHVATVASFDAVAIGAMGRERGWPTIVRVLALIRNAPVRCIFIGKVTDGSESALFREILQLRIADRFRYIGSLSRQSALEKASQCQFGFILFSGRGTNQKTGLPHKAFELMALGLPAVVSNYAEVVSSLILDIGCGIIVDPENDRMVADGIFDLFFRPLDRSIMGELGRLASLGRMAWEKDAERLAELCSTLLHADVFRSPS